VNKDVKKGFLQKKCFLKEFYSNRSVIKSIKKRSKKESLAPLASFKKNSVFLCAFFFQSALSPIPSP
jgi:hypothetical protein